MEAGCKVERARREGYRRMKTIDERIAEAEAIEKKRWEEYQAFLKEKTQRDLAHDAWLAAVCATGKLKQEKQIRDEIAKES